MRAGCAFGLSERTSCRWWRRESCNSLLGIRDCIRCVPLDCLEAGITSEQPASADAFLFFPLLSMSGWPLLRPASMASISSTNRSSHLSFSPFSAFTNHSHVLCIGVHRPGSQCLSNVQGLSPHKVSSPARVNPSSVLSRSVVPTLAKSVATELRIRASTSSTSRMLKVVAACLVLFEYSR